MNQADFFAAPAAHSIVPRARRENPASSHEAAHRARESGIAQRQADQVLAVVKRFPLATSAELSYRSNMNLYVVRRRLSDLANAGAVRRVEPTPESSPCFVSGMRVCRWKVA